MNIIRLDLLAYGPFDRQSLDFGTNGGLHIVYGPNEAGKSSALRALRGLLFGIEERTDDAFRHDNKSLRIGATLAVGDKGRLECVRRKGRKDTLRDGDDDKPLNPAQLQRMLGGVTEELFKTMFGISHQTLIEGGGEIAKGEGEIGSLLFSAAGGLARLQAAQRELESEADTLFTPRASSKTINQQLSELDKTRKHIKELQLTPQEWSTHDAALHAARDLRDSLERRLNEMHVKKSRLERYLNALPAVTQRSEALAKLQPLLSARLLRNTFATDRFEAGKSRHAAAEKAIAEQERLSALDEQLAGLSPAEGLLHQAGAIDGLYRQLTEYTSAVRDRPGIVLERSQHESQAAEALRRLGRGLADDGQGSPRLTDPQRAQIEELAQRHGALEQSVRESSKRVDQLRLDLAQFEQRQAALPSPREVEPLRRLLRKAEQQGDLAHELAAAEDALRRQQAESDLAFQRLGLWTGEQQALLAAALPGEETIERFQEELAEQQRELKQLQGDREAQQQQIGQLQAQIEQVGHTGPVPSDEDLRQARDKRDAGWRLIRAAWQGGAGPADTEAEYVASFPGSNNLATAYEAAVRAADELVDRLRREAERVERYAAAQASLRQQEQQRARLDEGLHRTVQELQSLRDDWNAQWQPFPLTPLPPREMLAWLRKQQKWAADCRQLHTASQNAASLRAKIESFQSELDAGLSSVGETPAVSSLDTSSLEKLTAQAATFCQSQDSLQQQHAELNRDLLRVRAELQAATAQAASAERDRAEWLQAWGREIGGLGLAENASPTQAREVIKRLDEWSKAMAAIAALTPRIEEIDSFCGRFARETQALLSAVSPDKAGTPPELAIADLNARLKQAQSQRQRRDDLRERRQQAADNLAQAERTVREKDRLLAQLCEEAGCQHADELAAAEEHSQQRARLESELDRLNRQLAELARGEPLPTFLEAATALPADQLEAELLRLQGQIQEAVREKEAAAEQFVTERNWLQERNGAEQAAEEAERAQGLLAALSSNVRHYARVRLASAALRRAIERYREKNQDPLLARASQTFAELTGGAFQGLRADTDEDGKQVLLGVREKTAETVRVEQMSDGTADQLYLALRLASLERYREQHDPPPFIVDDILIRFDDGRSLATLRALAQLAQRMQVIFFTHHQHLLDLAGQHLPADAWTRHELDSRQQPATV